MIKEIEMTKQEASGKSADKGMGKKTCWIWNNVV